MIKRMSMYKVHDRKLKFKQIVDLMSYALELSTKLQKIPVEFMSSDLESEFANKYCEEYFQGKVGSESFNLMRLKEDLFYVIDIIDWEEL